MNIFRLFEGQKIMKICSKTHQVAPFKNIFSEKHAPNPLANAWLRHASQAPQKIGPPWQILHTPIDYY